VADALATQLGVQPTIDGLGAVPINDLIAAQVSLGARIDEMRTELDGLNVALIPASGSRRGAIRDGSRSHNMAGAAGRYWAGVWRRAVEASGS